MSKTCLIYRLIINFQNERYFETFVLKKHAFQVTDFKEAHKPCNNTKLKILKGISPISDKNFNLFVPLHDFSNSYKTFKWPFLKNLFNFIIKNANVGLSYKIEGKKY